MDMDQEKELRNRIRNSDPTGQTELPDYLVAQAAMRKTKRNFSFRTARILVGAGSFAAVALVAGLSLPQFLTPQPLFTMASGGSSAMTSAESAPMAADAKVGMIWPGYVQYNYLHDGLSDQGGRGHIYQAQLVGDPTEILTKLMNFFGVQGEIVKDEWSTPQFPSFSVQSKNGSIETYLSIYWSGTGNWNYSTWDSSLWSCSGSDEVVNDSSDSSSSASTDVATEEARACNQPQPTPELIPSEDQMRQQAAELFKQLGMEIEASSFKTYRDDWGGSAYVELSFNGMPLPITVSVGWDLRGQLSYASGQSFELIDRGEFDTVSAQAAVSRIQEGNWYGSAPSSYYENQPFYGMARDAVATGSAVAVDSGESMAIDGDMVAPSTEPSESGIAVGEPSPTDFETIEPEIVDLTINRSETAMLGVYDANGGFWLVPGYILYNDQGWFDSIISVVEGVIELPKYDDIMPLIEPAPATKEG